MTMGGETLMASPNAKVTGGFTVATHPKLPSGEYKL